MSLQETLTENPPFIVDVTCSKVVSTSFPKFASLRMDVRKEVGPELVASACFLPFRRHSVDEFDCDPPHIVAAKTWEAPSRSRWFASVNRQLVGNHDLMAYNMLRFGSWKTREEWLAFVRGTNDEFYKALKPDGVLRYKLAELPGKRSVKLADLELMTNFQTVAKKQTTSNSGNPTYWLTMKPRPTSNAKTKGGE